MATSLSEGYLLIRLDAIDPADCLLEHDESSRSREFPFARTLHTGGAGTVRQVGARLNCFKVGDAVVACLSNQDISTNSHNEQVATVHANLACKISSTVSENDAARVPMAFANAAAILHSSVHIPFLAVIRGEALLSGNVLVVSSETVVPLIIIKLLRMYTEAAIFVVYEPESTSSPTHEALSIDPAMMAGAHFAQQPSSTSSISAVAGGLRSNLGHYGPYSGTGCFDLVLDLTGKLETPEPYRRLLCEEDGELYQLPQTMHVDFEDLFLNSSVMGELGSLLENGDIRPEHLYVRPGMRVV